MVNEGKLLKDHCPSYNSLLTEPNYSGWKHVFRCIDPHFWYAFGIVFAIGLSIMGAGIGILNVASSLSGCMIKTPRV